MNDGSGFVVYAIVFAILATLKIMIDIDIDIVLEARSKIQHYFPSLFPGFVWWRRKWTYSHRISVNFRWKVLKIMAVLRQF